MANLKPYFKQGIVEAGLDEAGRGCYAGPVVAAFVILPADYSHALLNDSKQLTRQSRENLRIEIEKEALDFAVAEVCNNTIDKINILNASFLAMHKALDRRSMHPDFLLIDGNRFRPYEKIPHECIVEGDGKYLSIAAASILAKTYRDEKMCKLAEQFPEYDWENNMGYGTPKHKAALEKYGITPYHRRSFKILNNQMQLFN